MFLQFARFYEAIYNMPSTDKPDAETIDDDELLDAWYTKYSRDVAIRSARASGNRAGFQMSDAEKSNSIATFGG